MSSGIVATSAVIAADEAIKTFLMKKATSPSPSLLVLFMVGGCWKCSNLSVYFLLVCGGFFFVDTISYSCPVCVSLSVLVSLSFELFV